MNFAQSIVSGFKNFSSVEGRASRSEFWNWVLFYYLGGPIAIILDKVISHGVHDSDPFYSYPLYAIFSLVALVPTITVGVRRLHDTNRQGWWLLIWLTVIGIIPLAIWACSKGTDGPNRFGGDPLLETAVAKKS